MVNEANFYFLKEKDWRPITKKLILKNGSNMSHQIAIFQLHKSFPFFGIISISNEADEIIEDCGGFLAEINDLIRLHFKESNYELLYGQEGLSIYLNHNK